jgi:hypothetical protein
MYNYNPYYGQQTYTQPRYQPIEPQYLTQQPKGLLGKSVDSVDVVKAIDIPLDGSVSYFPLTDGSAIVTKQLQMDGTSKIMVYKPIIEQKEQLKTISYEEFEELRKEVIMVKDRLNLLGGENNA